MTLGLLPLPTSGRGAAGVSGAEICSALTGTWARSAMDWRTVPLAITLPNRIARWVRAEKSYVFCLRSSTDDLGVSTTT